MRYRSNRQYLYPVMRPDSDDYGDAQLRTTLDQPIYDAELGLLHLTLRFDLGERSLISAIRQGHAKCAAMVYCGSTLQRLRLESDPEEPFIAQGSIPISLLRKEVQVHPVVLAARDLVHTPVSTNLEDLGQSVEIRQWAPMATDLNWIFNLDPNYQHVRGIFRLVAVEDEYLQQGQFDLRLDFTKPYVDIIANQDTVNAYKETRRESGESWTLPTIFTGAVISVLAYLKDVDEDEDSDSCEWANCIRDKLTDRGIDIGGPGREGSHSLFYAAQVLLESPFSGILGEWVSETDDPDEEEEEWMC